MLQNERNPMGNNMLEFYLGQGYSVSSAKARCDGTENGSPFFTAQPYCQHIPVPGMRSEQFSIR
jgi:hypothetical protein